MSRFVVDTPEWPLHLKLTVGWDEGLQTYFAQVDDRKTRDSLVWIGTIDVIGSVAELERRLNAEMRQSHLTIRFDADTIQQLESDQLTEETE